MSAGSLCCSKRTCGGRDGWGLGVWGQQVWRRRQQSRHGANEGRTASWAVKTSSAPSYILESSHVISFWMWEQCERTTRLSFDICTHRTTSSGTGRAANTVLPDLCQQKSITSLAPCLAFKEKTTQSFLSDDWITTKMIASGSDVTNDVVLSLAVSCRVLCFYLKMFISKNVFFSLSFLPSFNKKGFDTTKESRATSSSTAHVSAVEPLPH